MILGLTREQLHVLKEEARKSYPIEACAVLFGKLSEGEAIVTKIVTTPNILQSTIRFEADPQVVYAALEDADREGLHFIGLFHSHPAPAVPSSIDLNYMRLWGDAIWLILSGIDGSTAAFQMVKGKIRKIAVRLNNPTKQAE